MAFSYTKLACLLVICMAVASAPAADATISCGTVSKKLSSCLPYLKGGAGPSPACCGGVRALSSMAKSPADRKTACGCLKSTAGSVKGLSTASAGSLPGKCGVSIPYPISTTVDCSKVH